MQFHAGEHLQKLKSIHVETIGAMATSCSWNPEQTTDEAVKTKLLMPILEWNGTTDEPPNSFRIKQLMWNCVQEQLQDLSLIHI